MFGRKSAERVRAEQAEQDLEGRMSNIDLFPGSLEEYEQLKGAEYTIIDVQGNKKYLRGDLLEFKHLRDPTGDRKLYHEIVQKTLELGGDAIIRYTIVNNTAIAYSEMGIPVKKSSP